MALVNIPQRIIDAILAKELAKVASHPPDGCIGCEERQLSDRSCIHGLAPNASGSTKPPGLNWWPGDEIGEGHTPNCAGRTQIKPITGSKWLLTSNEDLSPPYKNKKSITNLFIVVIIQFIIDIFGIFLNSAVVYITIKHKQLRKLSGYILGAICFYDALYGINGIIPFVTMSAQFQIPLSICFFLQSPTPFIVLNSNVLMLFLGLERSLAVLLPIWHFSINSQSLQLKYAIFILFITFAGNFIIFFLIYDYVTRTETPQKLVYCLVSDILQGFALTFGANLGLITNLMTIAVYLLLWISVKLRKLNDADVNQRINKSIFVLITIYLLLWSISILFSSILIPNSTLDPKFKVFLSRLFVQLNRLATALNAPVLYFCSSEYRTFFRKDFKILGHPNLDISSRNNDILRQQSPRVNNFMMMTTISSPNIGHSLPIIN